MDPEQLPLRDLHLPEAIGWWPLAPGWWLLIALAAAGIGYLLYKEYLKWRWNAARRVALAELARLRRDYESGADALSLSKALSELLRRSMLAYAPRGEMAGLTGSRWLEWLDRGLDEPLFTQGPGKAIEVIPYQHPDKVSDETDIGGMIDAIHTRLKTPLAEGAV